MRRRAAAGVTTLVAAACLSGEPSPTGPLPAECRQLALDAGVDPDADDVQVVGIRDFEFVPGEITVTAGTRVVWVNCEPEGTAGGDHTSTSDEGAWDSPLLSRGQTFERPFDLLDVDTTFEYHCTPHPFMQGAVTVVPRPVPG